MYVLSPLFISSDYAFSCRENSRYHICYIFQVEADISEITKRVNELAGIKESDTGLGPPALWDLAADKQTLQSEQPLQVQS